MKQTFIRASMIGAMLAGALASVSCETTGDPSTGGIFWSERKAQTRLDERQARLNHIESRTERERERSREKQREINRLKKQKSEDDKQ